MGSPDHGNRYELSGVVAELDVLEPLAAVHPDAVVVPLYAPGFGLMPVTAALAGAVTPAMVCAVLGTDGQGNAILGGPESTGRPGAEVTTGPESGFTRLTPGLLSLLEAASSAGPMAYLETDYTGRDGHQTAAVWKNGALALGPLLLGPSELFVPGDAPITQALRMLGVASRGRLDEFVSAGLGRYRRTEDWM